MGVYVWMIKGTCVGGNDEWNACEWQLDMLMNACAKQLGWMHVDVWRLKWWSGKCMWVGNIKGECMWLQGVVNDDECMWIKEWMVAAKWMNNEMGKHVQGFGVNDWMCMWLQWIRNPSISSILLAPSIWYPFQSLICSKMLQNASVCFLSHMNLLEVQIRPSMLAHMQAHHLVSKIAPKCTKMHFLVTLTHRTYKHTKLSCNTTLTKK